MGPGRRLEGEAEIAGCGEAPNRGKRERLHSAVIEERDSRRRREDEDRIGRRDREKNKAASLDSTGAGKLFWAIQADVDSGDEARWREASRRETAMRQTKVAGPGDERRTRGRDGDTESMGEGEGGWDRRDGKRRDEMRPGEKGIAARDGLDSIFIFSLFCLLSSLFFFPFYLLSSPVFSFYLLSSLLVRKIRLMNHRIMYSLLSLSSRPPIPCISPAGFVRDGNSHLPTHRRLLF